MMLRNKRNKNEVFKDNKYVSQENFNCSEQVGFYDSPTICHIQLM